MEGPQVTHDPQEYARVQSSPEFALLRRRFRSFAFPMTAAFLLWYLLYVLLSTYRPDLMAIQVADNINIALIMGLLQFVSTFLITWLYVRHANRKIDPIAQELRARLEVDPSGAAVEGAADEPTNEELARRDERREGRA